jgi:hypothetical protein
MTDERRYRIGDREVGWDEYIRVVGMELPNGHVVAPEDYQAILEELIPDEHKRYLYSQGGYDDPNNEDGIDLDELDRITARFKSWFKSGEEESR